MTNRKVGSRVFAVRDADATTMRAYGFGTYLGDHPRPGWTVTAADRAVYESVLRLDHAVLDRAARDWYDKGVAEGRFTREYVDSVMEKAQQHREREMARPMNERVNDLAHRLSLNPKILLDRGGVVWGYECWWGEVDDDATEPPAQLVGHRQVAYVPAPQAEERP